MTRRRADAALADLGLFPSREQARSAILAGHVRADGEPITKAGQLVDEASSFEIAERPRFVSRGGDKLCGALDTFDVDVARMRAVDVGASTGGFTDCLLQHGAASVVAVDVGYGQLAWSLRTDSRVTVFERTNIRTADPVELGAPFELCVIDVSFIGLAKVLPTLRMLVADGGTLLALVKPQFEAGKGRVGKRGVVRDASVHAEVLGNALEAAAAEGFGVRGLTFSPIKGPNGNIEFWMWAEAGADSVPQDIAGVVAEAHEQLGD